MNAASFQTANGQTNSTNGPVLSAVPGATVAWQPTPRLVARTTIMVLTPSVDQFR